MNEINAVKNAVKKSKPPSKIKRTLSKSSFQLYALCAIPAFLVFVFSYLPMFGVVIAFKNFTYNEGIFGSKWVGFKNFSFLMLSKDFTRIAWNTIYLNFIFIFVGMAVSVGVAIFLFSIKSRVGVKTYQTIWITPNFLSWVVAGYMAYALLNPERGMINVALERMGIEGVQWYSKPGLWPGILTIFSTWKSFGMNSVIYYAALMGIDSSLFEAAEIDGAKKWQITKSITLPCLTPIIVVMSILAIGNIFRADFGLFYQLTRDIGALYSTTDVMDTYIFRSMRVIGDFSISAAAGLLQSVVGFLLVILTNYCVGKIEPDNALF